MVRAPEIISEHVCVLIKYLSAFFTLTLNEKTEAESMEGGAKHRKRDEDIQRVFILTTLPVIFPVNLSAAINNV